MVYQSLGIEEVDVLLAVPDAAAEGIFSFGILKGVWPVRSCIGNYLPRMRFLVYHPKEMVYFSDWAF